MSLDTSLRQVRTAASLAAADQSACCLWYLQSLCLGKGDLFEQQERHKASLIGWFFDLFTSAQESFAGMMGI